MVDIKQKLLEKKSIEIKYDGDKQVIYLSSEHIKIQTKPLTYDIERLNNIADQE